MLVLYHSERDRRDKLNWSCILRGGTTARPHPYFSHALATVDLRRRSVQGAGNFGFRQVGELAELGYRDIGASGLVEVLTDALQTGTGNCQLSRNIGLNPHVQIVLINCTNLVKYGGVLNCISFTD